MDQRSADVVVVGAGLSGLHAARALRRRGLAAVVLEASGRVGGRVRHEALGERWPGVGVEAGGQWLGPNHRLAHGLADELGLQTFATYAKGKNLFEWRGGLRRYGGTVPWLGALGSADVAQAVLRMDRMAATVPPEAPWLAPRAREWDSQTVWSWVQRNARTRLGRAFFALACEAVWAADPADVSLLHFLAYQRANDGLVALISTEGGAQERRVVGGSQGLADGLAAQLGDAVVLGAPVRALEQDDRGVVARTDDLEVRAARAIVAVPPAMAARIRYAPALPAERDQLTQRLPMGSVVKCHAVYDEPFWRDAGLSGQATSDIGPVKVVFDNSPPQGRPGVLVAFYEGLHARRATAWGPQERRRRTLEGLARFFGPRALAAEHYTDTAWTEEEHVRGCYGAFAPPGALTSCGPALRTPVGRLHWAGTESAVRGTGYMEGALEAGARAAREVAGAIGA
jgi:monoamine oxidase